VKWWCVKKQKAESGYKGRDKNTTKKKPSPAGLGGGGRFCWGGGWGGVEWCGGGAMWWSRRAGEGGEGTKKRNVPTNGPSITRGNESGKKNHYWGDDRQIKSFNIGGAPSPPNGKTLIKKEKGGPK